MPDIDLRAKTEQECVEIAKNILRGQHADQAFVFRLAHFLKSRFKKFGYARKLLWLARSDSTTIQNRSLDAKFNRKLRQQHALCTYKDNDLPVDNRFERALDILDREGDLANTTDPETLGLAGAIFKMKWEVFGQIPDLERSLLYYERGWAQEVGDGYTGINTAYILDLIAHQEELQAKKSGSVSACAAKRRSGARDIRTKITAVLPKLAQEVTANLAKPHIDFEREQGDTDWLYWILATLAEAYLGLGLADDDQFQKAKECMEAAAHLNRYDWMIESTARQVASLTCVLAPAVPTSTDDRSRQWQVLEALVGDRAPGVRSAFIGKVGLALSGGGFRAALFHIGVLARLAEMDVLRHVEYLSCVSGGSIIGAYYYLEIKKLLESENDAISRDDYIEVIKTIEREFLKGVQTNVRMQSLTSLSVNSQHDLTSGVLPSERTAQLYDELLFSRISYDGKTAPVHMNDLVVARPGGAHGEVLRPKDENWRRKNKVPILILNSTTMNTGHNWQFTATWMGEPPTTISNEVDGAKRLRRMYYEEAPDAHQKFRIGRAVAASAGVPALFAPIELKGLFKDMTVRLADGGVHDNQGVAALLEQGCTVLLVSDASGQLEDDDNPGKLAIQGALRADSILQERVRVAQYENLHSRERSGLLKSLMFLHLKKGLDSERTDWIGCLDPIEASDEEKTAAEKGVFTSYGIHKNVQRRIAAIRTDLDSFHDAEAYALMTSGYKMADFHFPANLQDARSEKDVRADWCFLRVESEMKKDSSRLSTLLDASSKQAFKVWDLLPWLRHAAKALMVILALIAVAIVVSLLRMPSRALLTIKSDWLAWTLSTIVLVALFGKIMAWMLNPAGELRKLATRFAVAAVVALIARIHLRFFDKLYLKEGELNKVLAAPAPPCS